MTMEMTPVQSSNVAAVGYDAATRALVVQFRDGARYRYADVGQELFDELLQAPSKGQFLHARLFRKSEHPAVRLPADAR